jgi:DNA-binding CsgD family transcriptional regulator
MVGAIEELEKASALCERIGFADGETAVAACLLEPIAGFIGAEAAVFRVFSIVRETPSLATVVTLGIPDSVNDAYATRYFRLDPVRRLLRQRFRAPLSARGDERFEWSIDLPPSERGTRAEAVSRVRTRREEFLRYRNEFLWPNKLYHHLGFCIQGPRHPQAVLFDFHRAPQSLPFSRLEEARAKLVAVLLHAKIAARPAPIDAYESRDLSPRESEVAQAVVLGSSNKEVATALGISVRTVENHLRSIFAKLDVATRTRLAAKFHTGRAGAVGRAAV